MARQKSNNLTPAIRAPFWKSDSAHGYVANTANATQSADNWAADNGYEQRWRNAANTDDIRGCSVNQFDRFLLSEEVYTPMRQHIAFPLATAASLVSQHFFTIPAACRLVGITEIHATAESTAATMTAYIEKLSGTAVPGTGTSLMSGTFNMKATANTLQSATLTTADTGDSDSAIRQLAAGDRVAIKFSTAGTELAGVVVTLVLAPAGGSHWVAYNLQANGDLADQAIFVANRDWIVTSVSEVHSTLGTNGGAVTLDVKKCTGTQAPSAGTTVLTSTFNLKSAINTVVNGTLSATASVLRLAPGNRLAVDYTGTLTAVAGVVVVVTLQAVERRKEVTFTLNKNANLVDQAFFTADRNYEIIFATANWGTAAASGNVQLTRDTATDAPGAGTDLLSMDTNAGWQVDGTANTPEVATWKDARFNFLMAGDRLSLDFNVGISLADFTATVSLRPC